MPIYYVATTGNNSNPGSEGLPWLTVQKAADTVVAGDTVRVLSGIYLEKVTETTAGTISAPIVYQPYNYITGYSDSGVTIGGFLISSPYVHVKGFGINGYGVVGYQGAIKLEAGANYFKASDLRIEITSGGLNTSGQAIHGIYFDYLTLPKPNSGIIERVQIYNPWYTSMTLHGNNHIISGCLFVGASRAVDEADGLRIHGNNITATRNIFSGYVAGSGSPAHTDIFQSFSTAGTGNNLFAHNFIFEKNLIIGCRDVQLFMLEDQSLTGAVSDFTIRNNLFIGSGYAGQSFVPRTNVYNNVFFRAGTNTAGPVLFGGGVSNGRNWASGSRCFNNIFLECGANPSDPSNGWYLISTGFTDALISDFSGDYNVVMGIGAGTTKTTTTNGSWFQFSGRETHGMNGVNPNFVNTGTNDWRLAANSLCRGSGFNLSWDFLDDYSNVTRTIPWDIGAYAYITSGIATFLTRMGRRPRFKVYHPI